MKDNVLYLTRYCGVEEYPVKTATWHILEGDGTEDDPDLLFLTVEFDMGTVLCEDTRELEANPSWEIEFAALEIPVKSLLPRFYLEQPNSEEDVYGNLYYTEHQPTIDNRMEIVEVDGKRLKIRLTGITDDVCYYDGAKPKNIMQLVAWFDKE